MRVPWNRGGLRTYLVLLALIACRPDHRALWLGLPLLLLGAALQIYAKGCLRQNQVVARGGPYRFVRHPFYTANLLIDLSIALMSGWWPLIAALPVWWLLVYLPVMRAEERHLAELFPDVYPGYQPRLPRLLPLRPPLPPQGEGFSWHNPNIAGDTVLPRLLRLLAYPLLFLVCQDVKSAAFRVDSFHLLIAATLFSLYGLAWQLKRHLVGRRPILPDSCGRPVARWLIVGGVLLAAAAIHQTETESEYALTALAVLSLLVSLALYLRSVRWRLTAEGVGITAAVLLCELPWLACLPVLFYAALTLDQRIAQGASQAALDPTGPSRRRVVVSTYVLMMVVGLAVAVTKEVWAR